MTPTHDGRLLLVINEHELVGFRVGGAWTFTATIAGIAELWNGSAVADGAVEAFTRQVVALSADPGLGAAIQRAAAALDAVAEGGAS